MIVRLLFTFFLTATAVFSSHAVDGSQGGDQFLDGIGETGLVARYTLEGTTEDSSRNQFHAALRGTGGTFVADDQFRLVQKYVQMHAKDMGGGHE